MPNQISIYITRGVVYDGNIEWSLVLKTFFERILVFYWGESVFFANLSGSFSPFKSWLDIFQAEIVYWAKKMFVPSFLTSINLLSFS